jgi:hypothetical protein
MPAKSNHPVFDPPANQNVKIWRYMDLSKYLSLLESRALFFARVDLMGDPYEGATSHANRNMRSAVYQDSIPQSVFDSRSSHLQWERQWSFINCWHMNEHESDAMWRLYARTTDAVAIQSTYAKLHRVLPDEAYLGVVRYIDYNNEWMPEGNTFYPLVHKRKSFEHERELRALIQDVPYKPNPDGSGARVFNYIKNAEGGRSVPIQLLELIENVYVAPTSPPWFYGVVKRTTERYEIDVPVEQSALDQSPEF